MMPLWKQRYYASTIDSAQIASSAPDRGLAVCKHSGASQLYALTVSTGALRALTDGSMGIKEGLISPDGRSVIYFRDAGGSETGHYVRISWEGGSAEDLTPNMPNYAAVYRPAFSGDGSAFAFLPAMAEKHHLYVLRFGTNEQTNDPRSFYTSSKPLDDATLSYDGNTAVVASSEGSSARQYELFAFDTKTGEKTGTLSDLPDGSLRAIRFGAANSKQLLASSDRSGFVLPVIWDIQTGVRTDLQIGNRRGDIQPLDWSKDGQRILLCCTWQASAQLLIYDCDSGETTELDHPSGAGYLSARFTPAQDEIITPLEDSTHPISIVALNSSSGKLTRSILSKSVDLQCRSLRSVSFQSSDGQSIQGWLGEPDGTGPFPTVIEMHGGPITADMNAFNPNAQAWLDHGFAYLSVNYRGSSTFGRDFKEKIWGDLGHWEVEDMVAAFDWLTNSGLAKPDAVVLTGASFGGYLTLMGLGKRPDLWACGIALVATGDYVSIYEHGNAWTRGFFTAMMGGTLNDKRDAYLRSSPITYAENISAPLLVIQALNDLRCPAQQMINYAERMRQLGKHFEIDWYDGGHRSMSAEYSIGFQERTIAFAEAAIRARQPAS